LDLPFKIESELEQKNALIPNGSKALPGANAVPGISKAL